MPHYTNKGAEAHRNHQSLSFPIFKVGKVDKIFLSNSKRWREWLLGGSQVFAVNCAEYQPAF